MSPACFIVGQSEELPIIIPTVMNINIKNEHFIYIITAAFLHEVEKLKNKGITPNLTVVIVGNDGASLSYVRSKNKAAEKIGMTSDIVHLDEDTSEEEVLSTIDRLNNDDHRKTLYRSAYFRTMHPTRHYGAAQAHRFPRREGRGSDRPLPHRRPACGQAPHQ